MSDKRLCACGCGQEIPSTYGPRFTIIKGHKKNLKANGGGDVRVTKKTAKPAPRKPGRRSDGGATLVPVPTIEATPMFSVALSEKSLDTIFANLPPEMKAAALSKVLSAE